MVKKLIPFLALGALGACTEQATTPLARLGTTKVEVVVAKGQVNIELHVDGTSGCPLIGDDAKGKFDGQPMEVSRGGYDTDATGCYPIAFWFNSPPADALTAFENITNGSEMIVQDHSALWSLGMTRVYANDFVDDPVNNRITWQNVDLISTASLTPHVNIELSGNTITYPKGTVVEAVEGYAHPTPTRCDGPGECFVNLRADRTFKTIDP